MPVVAMIEPPAPRVSDRPNVKVVSIPYAATSGGVNGYVRITLPRAPWEHGGAHG